MPIVHNPPSASATIPFHEDRGGVGLPPRGHRSPPGKPGKRKSHVRAGESSAYVFGNAFEMEGKGLGDKPMLLDPPSRPLFGGHCIAEAGGSICAPNLVMLLMRGVSLAGGVVAAALAAPEGLLSIKHVSTFPFILFLVVTVLSCLCSLVYVLARTPDASLPRYIEGSKYWWLANVTVPTHQFALSANVFATAAFWSALREGVSVRYTHVGVTLFPVVALGVDLLISTRHHYKLFYIVLCTTYPLGFVLAQMFSTSIYTALNADQAAAGSVRGTYVRLAVFGAGAPVIVWMLSKVLGLARRGDSITDELRFSRDTRVFDDAVDHTKNFSQHKHDVTPPPEFTTSPSQLRRKPPTSPGGYFEGDSPRGNGPYVYDSAHAAQRPQSQQGQFQPAPQGPDYYAHSQNTYDTEVVAIESYPELPDVSVVQQTHTHYQPYDPYQNLPDPGRGPVMGAAGLSPHNVPVGPSGHDYYPENYEVASSANAQDQQTGSAPTMKKKSYAQTTRHANGNPTNEADIYEHYDTHELPTGHGFPSQEYEDTYGNDTSAPLGPYPGHPEFPSFEDPPRRPAPRQSTVTFGPRHIIQDNPLTPMTDPYGDDARVSDVADLAPAPARGGGNYPPAPMPPTFR